MKKRMISMLAVLAFALTGCPEDDPVKKCTADCNGALENDQCVYYPNTPQYLSGTVTCDTETCTLDFSACQTEPDATIIGEFEQCGAQNTECDTDLTCRDAVGTGTTLCWTECDASATADPCGTDRSCALVSQTDPTDGVCFSATAQRDEACLLNGLDCTVGDCDMTVHESDPEGPQLNCKLECPEAELDTQGSCPTAELCLSSGWIYALDPDELCTNPGTVDTCSSGMCHEGWTDDKIRCAETLAWCGTREALLGGFTDGDINAYFTADPDGCNNIDDHQMCGIQNATGQAASAQCVGIAQGGSGILSACLAICDQESGLDLDCGDDGAGNPYVCAVPPPGDEFYFTTSGGLDCTDDTPCDTGAGYHCEGPFGDGHTYCARALKMCLTP